MKSIYNESGTIEGISASVLDVEAMIIIVGSDNTEETSFKNADELIAFIRKAKQAMELNSELTEALMRYEKWEADLLLEDRAWNRNAGLPIFTQELYDAWTEIQVVRNRALGKAKEVLAGS